MAWSGLSLVLVAIHHGYMTTITAQQIKLGQRQLWAAGNYQHVARLIAAGATELVDAAQITAGERVLDVATGTGNAALEAAARGARVTGVDITPELFSVARARAIYAEVPLGLTLGDAEELPFEDGSFDVVISAFGVQYAPRRDVAMAELTRVCRPGGRIAVANWAPESPAGRYIDLMNGGFGLSHADLSPTAWGDPDEVRRLFGVHELQVRTEIRQLRWVFPSLDECIGFFESNFGCAVTARKVLGVKSWNELRGDIGLLFSGLNKATDGTLVLEHEYLLALANR